MAREDVQKPDPSSELLRELLEAPDRDHFPGQRPIVSVRDDEEPAFLSAVESCSVASHPLSRRGIWHGVWAELEESAVVPPPGPPLEALLAQRWHTARPILLRGLVRPRPEFDEEIAQRRRLHDELTEPGGLLRFLKSRRQDLAPHFGLQGRVGRLADPERDIERVSLDWTADPEDVRAPRAKDLWAKSAWLSTHPDDASLRLRLSFGSERDDDAARDIRRHRRVTELAELLLPECTLLHECDELQTLIHGFVGSPTFLTQHIAYWNAPEGGALFHHDAFDESPVGGQRGVCYVQLSGATAWLALSIEDLTRRVIEFGEYLIEGELGWVRAQTFRRPDQFERFTRMLTRFKRIVRELAKPDCGSLGRLVNRGPEFTSFLADAGHAYVLRPGDVLLLPNHGLERTAMHSVFCAGDDPAYGLSTAIRETSPPEPVQMPDTLPSELSELQNG